MGLDSLNNIRFYTEDGNKLYDFSEPIRTDAHISMSEEYLPIDYSDFKMKYCKKALIK